MHIWSIRPRDFTASNLATAPLTLEGEIEVVENNLSGSPGDEALSGRLERLRHRHHQLQVIKRDALAIREKYPDHYYVTINTDFSTEWRCDNHEVGVVVCDGGE